MDSRGFVPLVVLVGALLVVAVAGAYVLSQSPQGEPSGEEYQTPPFEAIPFQVAGSGATHSVNLSVQNQGCLGTKCGGSIVAQDFEGIQNYVVLYLSNVGGFQETVNLSCSNPFYRETISLGKGKSVQRKIPWSPNVGPNTITCSADYAGPRRAGSTNFVIGETDWHKYFRTRVSGENYLRETQHCDISNSVVKGYSNSLTLSNPQATVLNYIDWMQKNIPYNYEMYNNIILDGQDAFYGMPSASGTIALRKGICRHQAIVFVSLARARGMPARTIWVWVEGCPSPFDLQCSASNFLNRFGLLPYNHAIAQVWLNGQWQYVDATSGKLWGPTLPSWYKNPTVNETGLWGC